MSHSKLLESLGSPDLHTRLQAARSLAQCAGPGDAKQLQEALALEQVVWVKTALKQALKQVSNAAPRSKSVDREEMEEIVPSEVFEQIRTIAINETTKQVVHEISPILGALRLYAKEEIQDFDVSKTRVQLDRLHDLLRALDRLSRAAVAPVLQEFELSELIRRIGDAEALGHKIRIDLAGSTPLVVLGDPTLTEIAVSNGIRNAVEAVEALHGTAGELPPVVVTWAETDREVWIAVLDKGAGPPVTVDKAFEIGTTTKEGHLGMGLATARQALKSMSGTISLVPRAEGGGARFELRWPKTVVPDQ